MKFHLFQVRLSLDEIYYALKWEVLIYLNTCKKIATFAFFTVQVQ